MHPNHCPLAQLPDDQLLLEVKRLAAQECQATAALIASLCELDSRRLYVREGYSSLFAYCTAVLGLSESAAYLRIEAARAAARFPAVLERLAAGALNLTAVKLLAPHLTNENALALLDAARGLSKAAVEEMVARLRPRPDARAFVRKLPARVGAAPIAVGGSDQATGPDRVGSDDRRITSIGEQRPIDDDDRGATESALFGTAMLHPRCDAAPANSVTDGLSTTAHSLPQPCIEVTRHRQTVTPLAPDRYKVQMTVSGETRAKLRRAQDLLRHSIPDANPAAIFDRALTLLLEHLERTRHAALRRVQGPASGRRRQSRPRPSAADGGGHPGDIDAPTLADVPHDRTLTADCAGVAGASAQAEPLGTESEDIRDGLSLRCVQPPDSDTMPTAELGLERVAGPTHAGHTDRRHRSRHIPAAVKREVWARDGGQCAFVSPDGHRCGERGFLEYHHRIPYADGGQAAASNVSLRCRMHNVHEAVCWFGDRV